MRTVAKKPDLPARSTDNPELWTTLALEYLDQGVTVFDQNLRLVAWNQRVKELLDLPDEFFQQHVSLESMFRYNARRDEYGEGDIDAQVTERVKLARTFKPHYFERSRPDGTVIEIRGNPLPDRRGFVTTYTDITERKLTEQQLEQRVERRTQALREESEAHQATALALRQNEIWIRKITDAVPVLIAYVNADLKYQFANKKHLEWFNLNPEKLINSSIYEQVEKHNRAKFHRDISSVLKGQLVSNEYALTGQHSKTREIAITFVPPQDESGEIQGFFFLGQDMTEHNLSQRQLSESHKMQALGQMTGGIAHDFNNLLTIILGNLSLLDAPEVDKNEIREIGQACRRASRRGSELIQRLLSFSRRQSLNPVPTNINALIEEIKVLLERTLGENIHVATDLDPDNPTALVDANQLETSLLNLALNARDAMPAGGKLTITTRHSAPHRDISGEALMLSVSDEGTGMSQSTLERVFEPFFSTKAKGSGTGLGLSMVYGFVKQSGGHIEVLSRLQKGSCIKIFLPADSSLEVDSASDRARTSAVAISARILLAEDDADVRDYVSRALKRLGYDINSVNTGDAALRALKQDSDYDLLLTDIIMPGQTDGLALAKFVMQHYPETRVLCMSGYSEKIDSKIDTHMLIRKPFSSNELAARVRERLSNA